MPVERAQVFSSINVPQSDSTVPTPASNRMSIRAERDVVYLIPMSAKRSQMFTTCSPQADSVVPTAASQCASIGTVRYV